MSTTTTSDHPPVKLAYSNSTRSAPESEPEAQILPENICIYVRACCLPYRLAHHLECARAYAHLSHLFCSADGGASTVGGGVIVTRKTAQPESRHNGTANRREHSAPPAHRLGCGQPVYRGTRRLRIVVVDYHPLRTLALLFFASAHPCDLMCVCVCVAFTEFCSRWLWVRLHVCVICALDYNANREHNLAHCLTK